MRRTVANEPQRALSPEGQSSTRSELTDRLVHLGAADFDRARHIGVVPAVVRVAAVGFEAALEGLPRARLPDSHDPSAPETVRGRAASLNQRYASRTHAHASGPPLSPTRSAGIASPERSLDTREADQARDVIWEQQVRAGGNVEHSAVSPTSELDDQICI